MNGKMVMESKPKKMENKMTGFHVRILDDGTYLMRTENKNYEMCKEYSYENMDELHKGMKQIMGKMDKHNDSDELEKKF